MKNNTKEKKQRMAKKRKSSRIRIKDRINQIYDLPIGKRLKIIFGYIGIVVLLMVAVSLVNIISLRNMTNEFHSQIYTTEERILKAQVSMKNIENNIYRSYITKNKNLCSKYIESSEAEYGLLDSYIKQLSSIPVLQKGKNKETIKSLQLELKKADRYRQEILKSAKVFDQDKIYSTYKNDYVPIHSHMLEEFEELENFTASYGQHFMQVTNIKVAVSIGLFLLLFAVGALSCIHILKRTIKSIIKPVDSIMTVMKEIADGNLGVELHITSKDEMGILCQGIMITIEKLNNYINNITYVVKQLEQKNLAVLVDLDYEGDFKPIKTSLENTILSFKKVIEAISLTARDITTGSAQIALTAKTVADGSVEQNNRINSLMGEVEAIVEMINTNTLQTGQVSELTKAAVSAAREGDGSMKRVLEDMEVIKQQAEEISQIIAVIEQIAEQTNLLALNAAIEASRAGENGKGFGVVASEIGKLAARCSQAVQSTSGLINSTVNAIRSGAEQADNTAGNFKRIVKVAEETNDVMEKLAHNTSGIENELKNTHVFLKGITPIIEKNAAAAQESAAMSEEFIIQADKLEGYLKEYSMS
ncbi:methyl-accepting chemotaxis protein [Anaerocolumna xylanovorans]|uniref:Methyl-accepting chemotaxis protein n=1 Tax=Anaerocolumna xylanovorans DSM 12503 TaxID=1121345 RepID=A0A1M7YEZ4_9FIRM|nr:HAMP domain-containing methyl-accepting chemotaxis protein [Anaerocolumna xylanovorans]SHO51183.1 Methyl-accepting chemotaxis protein [Anaerocolumna xylanovorans DSM 12503]